MLFRSGGSFLVPMPVGGDRWTAALEVKAYCPRQWLDLAVDPGAGPVAVDDVTVEPER